MGGEIPWSILPVLGPFALATIVLVSMGTLLFRSLENSRLQTARQVETQLAAKDAVIELQRETIERDSETLGYLMESARFSVETLTAIRASVESWE